nr:pyruvate ferredoxin oxidoreductase [Deltaproteobacteria bacterium]NIS79726.1 pyruvate ferredoxin oxidoreductase [Anaerolineales bacterium]
FERGHPIPYICYDNEAYMNTGIQRCSSTPLCAATTTQPAGRLSWGKDRPKKNMPAIAMAHDIDYVATATVSYPKDLHEKVKKALTMEGPSYIQVHTPCCTGWGFPAEKTVEIGRLAVSTGLAPLFEMERGEITAVHKLEKQVPVEAYLTAQGRFKHLFQSEQGKREISKIQRIADRNIEALGLLQTTVAVSGID